MVKSKFGVVVSILAFIFLVILLNILQISYLFALKIFEI